MKETTTNWLASSDYDLETAGAMLKSRRYLYVVFMCHLALEKTLKAIYAEIQGESPPRTHDLLFLIRRLELALPKTHLEFIGVINNASIPTRYPEDLKQIVSQYPRRTASSYLAKTKRAIKWLRKSSRLTGQ
jgi:HEPN domain-containing protein